jgi:hypothetical protein|tara:strand:+ start:1081 stop:1314 length:234 start_codon:yes stop_codon:yes gene_type:complete
MKEWVLGLAGLCIFLLISAQVLANDLSDIERDARALELYLQDQSDYEEYCPHLDWDQPSLSHYKVTLKSHLPEGCKE